MFKLRKEVGGFGKEGTGSDMRYCYQIYSLSPPHPRFLPHPCLEIASTHPLPLLSFLLPTPNNANSPLTGGQRLQCWPAHKAASDCGGGLGTFARSTGEHKMVALLLGSRHAYLDLGGTLAEANG